MYAPFRQKKAAGGMSRHKMRAPSPITAPPRRPPLSAAVACNTHVEIEKTFTQVLFDDAVRVVQGVYAVARAAPQTEPRW